MLFHYWPNLKPPGAISEYRGLQYTGDICCLRCEWTDSVSNKQCFSPFKSSLFGVCPLFIFSAWNPIHCQHIECHNAINKPAVKVREIYITKIYHRSPHLSNKKYINSIVVVYSPLGKYMNTEAAASAGSPRHHLHLPALSCAQIWQIELERGSRDGGWISITGRRKAAWGRVALIGSGDPVQPLRTGWHQVSTVNYSAPSEHQGQERLAQTQAQHMREATVELKGADNNVFVCFIHRTLSWNYNFIIYFQLFKNCFCCPSL